MNIARDIKLIAPQLEQVAPYVVRFKGSHAHAADISNLCRLARLSGSTAKVYTGPNDGRIRISDPLCRMLEQAGMNR